MILLMAAANGLLAQVYKSVGPDGKIVYTDKPPTGADSKSTVISTPTQGQPQRSSPSTKPTPVAPVSQGAKSAVAKKASRNDAPAMPAVDGAVKKAVIGVMGYDDLVRQAEDVCMRTLPTSFKKYSAATNGWKQRNAVILSQYQRVLSQAFSASQRQAMAASVRTRNQQMFAPILDAPVASKIKWCDQTADEINNGAMDVHNKPNLSLPLMNYRPKQ